MIDSVIFDIDGTLWDSRPRVREAWSSMVEQLSGRPWEISDGDFTALFGQPMDAISRVLFPDEPDEAERMRKAQLCYDAENAWLKDHPGALFPQVEETLAALSRDYPLYLCSNCQCGYIEVMLNGTGLGKYFSGQLCFGDTGTPKGVTLRTLMQRHGLKSSVYVGDTQGDADACALAELPMIYAAYGFGSVEKPDYTIRTFEELPALLKTL